MIDKLRSSSASHAKDTMPDSHDVYVVVNARVGDHYRPQSVAWCPGVIGSVPRCHTQQDEGGLVNRCFAEAYVFSNGARFVVHASIDRVHEGLEAQSYVELAENQNPPPGDAPRAPARFRSNWPCCKRARRR